MRTDGVTLSHEAVAQLRDVASSSYGHDYIPPSPRMYKSKIKNAQEAHEAIRPTKPWLSPAQLPSGLSKDQVRLYDLIWRRALACQMSNAEIQQVWCQLDGLVRFTTVGDHYKYASGAVAVLQM